MRKDPCGTLCAFPILRMSPQSYQSRTPGVNVGGEVGKTPPRRAAGASYPASVSIVSSQLSGLNGLVLVVRLPAQLVDDTSALIRDEVAHRLPNAEGAGLVLDCAEVSLINSIGITCLLQVQDHCRRMKAGMCLAAVPPAIETFLRTVKLDKRFPAHATVEGGVAALDGRG